ncbi:MAG TPA: RNA polymerase sigma factor [Candidatus Dormibacteraeota bacterium]|nr:RNA polymerase sigma factor [Candidatus Dormibacteraeota bacterium]
MSVPLQDENAASPYVEWLDRARGQDRYAFAELYEATYRRVFGFLLARVGDRAAAEDLLQEVYLAALQAIGHFRGRTEGEFIGWLLKIAHGKSVDRLRSRYRHPEIKTSDVTPTDVADPLDAIEQRLRLDEIADALSQLTEDQRNVVLNRLVLGLDLEETGRMMRKNVGSIKALQHRALARLAKILTSGADDHA